MLLPFFLFHRAQSKAVSNKKNWRTCPLPCQAAPERDVGQHAGEGRREGHEGGCVERHDLREMEGEKGRWFEGKQRRF